MNIVGFLFVGMFGVLAIWSSRAMAKDDRMEGFRDCPRATGTVYCTRKPKHDSTRYQYKVEFRDQDGNEALGFSDSFQEKRTLQNDEIVTFYYRPVKQGEHNAQLKAITHAVSQAAFGRTPPEDLRPQYDIRFCDQRVYEREDKSTKRMTRIGFFVGCVLLILAVVVLFVG